MGWRSSVMGVAALAVACGSTDGPLSSGPAGTGAPATATASAIPTGTAPPSAPVAVPAPVPPPPAAGADSDGDGIPDATEAQLAADYMPFVSVHPSDGCPTHGIAYRLSPHPKEPGRVMIWADVLYDADCGASGHHGDDEMFGAVIDPKKPAPAGILAVRGISHQGTPCEHTTTCGACAGMTACAKAANGRPVVFPSKDKHGNYADKPTCDGSFVCDFGGCALASADASVMVNVGEPDHPLVHDLSTNGFITQANGWKNAELFHFDPWKPGDFGGAGDVSQDLVDPSFVVDTTACH